MKLAIDVHYHDDKFAVAAGILFQQWDSKLPEEKISVKIDEIEPYESGSFYKRELPCIQTLLNSITVNISTIIVDGYVLLGSDQTPGLGAHLYKNMAQPIPVIGVAKNCFPNTPEYCQLTRGKSKKPLYVTAIGMEQSLAKERVKAMHGNFRLPTLLKLADNHCREMMTHYLS